MKLQLQPGALRLRVTESELALLLQGEALNLELTQGASTLFELDVRLADVAPADDAAFNLLVDRNTQAWRLVLRKQAVADYERSLPRRDALVLESLSNEDAAEPDLRVMFEVDVRDSVRMRGVRGTNVGA